MITQKKVSSGILAFFLIFSSTIQAGDSFEASMNPKTELKAGIPLFLLGCVVFYWAIRLLKDAAPLYAYPISEGYTSVAVDDAIENQTPRKLYPEATIKKCICGTISFLVAVMMLSGGVGLTAYGLSGT